MIKRVRELLVEPDVGVEARAEGCVLSPEISAQWEKDRVTFEEKARRWTVAYAGRGEL